MPVCSTTNPPEATISKDQIKGTVKRANGKAQQISCKAVGNESLEVKENSSNSQEKDRPGLAMPETTSTNPFNPIIAGSEK